MTKEEFIEDINKNINDKYSVGVYDTASGQDVIDSFVQNGIEFKCNYNSKGMKDFVVSYGLTSDKEMLEEAIYLFNEKHTVLFIFPTVLEHDDTETYIGYSVDENEKFRCFMTEMCDVLERIPKEFIFGYIKHDEENDIDEYFINENHYSKLSKEDKSKFYNELLDGISKIATRRARARKLNEALVKFTLPYDVSYFDSLILLNTISIRHNIVNNNYDARMIDLYKAYAYVPEEVVEEKVVFIDVAESLKQIAYSINAEYLSQIQEQVDRIYTKKIRQKSELFKVPKDFAKTAFELSEILNYLPDEMLEKIPNSFTLFLETVKSNKHSYDINVSRKLEEHMISEKLKGLITFIYRNYLISDHDRAKLDEALYNNMSEAALNKKRKYSLLYLLSSNDIFTTDDYKEYMKEDTYLTVYDNHSFIRSLYNKILFYLKYNDVII